MQPSSLAEFTDEDAFNTVLRGLHGELPNNGWGHYGYDLYLPTLVRSYLTNERKLQYDQVERELSNLSPNFYAAAWELCRRGILRPGIRRYGQQSTDDGSAGNGYSITPFGKVWLSEGSKDSFVPTEPERFAKLLSSFRDRFGGGFYQRAQEAVRCYGAHAYLACCAMSGAATESVLLSIAIAKRDEESVLHDYRRAGGRKKIEDSIVGKLDSATQTEFRGFSSLLHYWRDESAHGASKSIADNEAFTSLALLLRFCIFVDQRWNDLTSSSV